MHCVSQCRAIWSEFCSISDENCMIDIPTLGTTNIPSPFMAYKKQDNFNCTWFTFYFCKFFLYIYNRGRLTVLHRRQQRHTYLFLDKCFNFLNIPINYETLSGKMGLRSWEAVTASWSADHFSYIPCIRAEGWSNFTGQWSLENKIKNTFFSADILRSGVSVTGHVQSEQMKRDYIEGTQFNFPTVVPPPLSDTQKGKHKKMQYEQSSTFQWHFIFPLNAVLHYTLPPP